MQQPDWTKEEKENNKKLVDKTHSMVGSGSSSKYLSHNNLTAEEVTAQAFQLRLHECAIVRSTFPNGWSNSLK